MDLKISTAKAKSSAKEEKDNRAKEEKERFCEKLADMRDIFQNIWREEKLKRGVQEKFQYLEDIRNEKIFCQGHQAFKKSPQAALFYNMELYSGINNLLTEDQLETIHQELKSMWVEPTKKHAQNDTLDQYIVNVATVELITKLYGEEFQLDQEEAIRRIMLTPEIEEDTMGGKGKGGECDRPKSSAG